MRIQHNIMAMSAYRNYTNNVSAMKKNLEKLSSGYKINRAGDDAAGLAISEKMRAQITGLETAQKNAKDGISLVQTAEGALTEVHDMLNRMVELATQSANGTYDNTTDRAQMQKEIEQLKSEINRIADSSNFNGIQLLDGSMDTTVKTTGDADLIATDAQVVADGQLAKNPQAGKYSIDFSNTTLTAKGDGGDATFTIFGQDALTLTLAKGDELSGGDLAKKIADLWNAAGDSGKTAWKDALGIEMNATVEGNKLVFTMDKAPTAAFTAGATTGKFGSFVGDADADGVIGNNGEEVTVTVEKEAVDTTTLRMYGQAKFELAAAAAEGKVGVVDGATVTIGDETYVFAVGKDSKYKNAANVVNLTDKEVGATDLIKTAAQRLSTAAAGNARFKVGSTLNSGTITVTEKEGGVDYAKNNLSGADGKGTLGVTARTKDAKPKDWAGLIKTGMVDDKATGNGLTLQIGDTADAFNQLKVNIKDCHVAAIGIGDVSIADQASAAKAVDSIKAAINYVSDVRGTLGATQNRLDHTINNLSVMTENIQDAESTIRDVDVAEEMMAYTKNNILIQSAQAMLAQANQVPQGVLQLLQ